MQNLINHRRSRILARQHIWDVMKKNEQTRNNLQQVMQESRAENAALRKLIEALHKDSQKQKKQKNDSPQSIPSGK